MNKAISGLLLVGLTGLACSASQVRIKKDPLHDAFFEKTRLIMTDEEISVYKHLRDAASREEFIAEFWKSRDPDPGTEENEFEQEFEERVRYANMWFGAFNPDRGRDSPAARHSKDGWNTDRGRIYIVLGPPEEIFITSRDGLPDYHPDGRRDMKISMEEHEAEAWVFRRFGIVVYFHKASSGDFYLNAMDSELREVMEIAKLNMIGDDYAPDIKRLFKFKTQFKDEKIIILIPAGRVTFDEKLRARFKIKIGVFRNDRKDDALELVKEIEETEEGLPEKKNLILEIPYPLKQKGKYYFDVTVEDTLAVGFSRYRNFAKATY
jgi:GWxTD domain-containing protein